MIKILKNKWKILHKLIYIIAVFGSLHYIWLSKTIFFKPLIYSIIIVVLLALRIKIKKKILIMDESKKKEIQSATLERLINHLRDRKDVQNIDLMNLAGFCRNCLSRWYREEAEKKGIEISDPDARNHIYGMPYSEWKDKYQK